MKACLIGKTLKHSFSRPIHQALGTDYDLVEVSPQNLQSFVQSGGYDCYNVTVPYKQAIMPFLDRLDASAVETGAVNTVANVNGQKVGFNTDIDGMQFLFERKNFSLCGKDVVILGDGGTSHTAQALCKRHQAKSVAVVGLQGRWNYSNYWQLSHAQVLINTTPVGMYPDCGQTLVDLDKFPHLQFVADVIYNPQKTQLLLDAEKRSIACSGGLSMLVRQAVAAEQIWQKRNLLHTTPQILAQITAQFTNIVLVGMPSCGKTTVGQLLAQKTGRTFVDLDLAVEQAEKMPVPQIFATFGEQYFRNAETAAIKNFGKQSGLVIACGGGTPLREENRNALRQNGFVVWLQRDLALLSDKNRPLSQQQGVAALYEQRKDIYRSVCDVAVVNNDLTTTVLEISNAYEKNIGN